MTEKEIKERLFEKLERNMGEYRKELLQCPPETLIEQAGEIHAAQMVYEELRSGEYWEEQYEYLLRFQNPLELMRDQWSSYMELDPRDEMSHILSELVESDSEGYYELDPEYASPEPDNEMTLS